MFVIVADTSNRNNKFNFITGYLISKRKLIKFREAFSYNNKQRKSKINLDKFLAI